MSLEHLEGVELQGGRYVLAELLGQGGYGAVFRARQPDLGRDVAVKILLPRGQEVERFIERFRREARATARLRHQHAIEVYDFARDDERELLYIVMEYLDGVSLDELIRSRGVLDVHTTVAIISQIASCLAEAHGHGIVHRDMKPHNIMLVSRASAEFFVKVIDFGIAKILEADAALLGGGGELTQTATMIGTPHYMAPEQISRDGVIDSRTDQYALAMCVYKMLLGHSPYAGQDTWEIISEHMKGPPQPLRDYDASLVVSDDFERVLRKALRKDKEQRYPDVMSFARALATVAQRDNLLVERGDGEVTRTQIIPAVLGEMPEPTGPTRRERPVSEVRAVTPAPTPRPMQTLATSAFDGVPVAAPPAPRAAREITSSIEQEVPAPLARSERPGRSVGVIAAVLLVVVACVVAALASLALFGEERSAPEAHAVQVMTDEAQEPPRREDERSVEAVEQTTARVVRELASRDGSGAARGVASNASEIVRGFASQLAPRRSEKKRRERRAVKAREGTPITDGVEVAPKPTIKEEPEAKPAPVWGEVRVAVKPYGDVYIDGKLAKSSVSSPQLIRVEVGPHELHVVKNGRRFAGERVVVRADKVARVLLYAVE